MLGVWWVLALCSVSSGHCARSGLRPSFKTDNMFDPRAVCLWLTFLSCWVWWCSNIIHVIFQTSSFQNLLTDDMLTWYITPQLAVVNIVTSSNKVLTLSVWLQNLPHKSRFPHKLVIFVNDCERRRELHHSHKFSRILICCALGKWGMMACRWIHGRTVCYEIYIWRWQKY